MKRSSLVISIGLFVILIQVFFGLILWRIIEYLVPQLSEVFIGSLLTIIALLIPIIILFKKIGFDSIKFESINKTFKWISIFIPIVFLLNAVGNNFHYPKWNFSNFNFNIIFVSLLVSPVLEEVLYRGYILENLLDYYSKFVAVIITSILSASAHIIAYKDIPSVLVFIFFVSIIHSLSYLKGKLGTPIVIHIIFNFFAAIWV